MTSEVHRKLVAYLAEEIQLALGPPANVLADHKLALHWPAPPLLAEARPDVFGRSSNPPSVLIGEAKTRSDIERAHTESQLMCYFQYLRSEHSSELWLAVPWAGLDAMYFVANRCRRLAGAQTIGFKVFGLAWERHLVCRTVRG